MATKKETTKKETTPKKATSGAVGRQELSRAAEVVEATIVTVREALQSGDEVRLVGFGSFKVRTSAARKGVNPQTRRPLEVPAKERVRFSPGKELSDAVLKKK